MGLQIHNIGIIAHIDAGKTTTTERLLFLTGKSHRLGTVDQGTAIMDWMEQEQNRGITITSAATTVQWKSHTINIIDTPGHVDFTIEVERALKILDGAVGVFCAVGGVEPQSETVWHQSEHYHVAKIAYINKIDRLGADFYGTLQDIQKKLNIIPIPLFLPIGVEKDFEGIIDVLAMQEIHWDEDSEGAEFNTQDIRPEFQELADKYYANIIDHISGLNSESANEIAELYLEEQPIPRELIEKTLKLGVLEGTLLPIFCGASLKNIGIQPLLDGITTYLPTPQEVPLPKVFDMQSTEKIPAVWNNDNRLMLVIFKSEIHKDYGLIHYVRIYRGAVKQASVLHDLNTGKKERITRILKMHAHKYEQVDSLQAGEIGAVIGPKDSRTGHTLSDIPKPILVLEPLTTINPVIVTSVEVHNIAERDKLLAVLEKIAIEDPSFHFKEDEDTGQVLISGMGELHLEVIVTRIKDDFNLPVRQGKPQVNYRESIQKTHSIVYNLQDHNTTMLKEKDINIILQIEVAPASAGSGIIFEEAFSKKVNEQGNPIVPLWIVPVVEKSIHNASSSGIVLGYPITDMKILIQDIQLIGDFKTTANDMLIQYSCTQALFEACKNADPITLEPIMSVVIRTPNEFLGEATNTITTRKGIVHEVEHSEAIETIRAEASLRELFGFSTTLRNATQGRAVFTMEFAYFAPMQQ